MSQEWNNATYPVYTQEYTNQSRFNNRGRDDRPDGRRYDNRGSQGGNQEQLVIYVETGKIGRIIGKGGSKIRELEERSGAKINIDRSTSGSNNTAVALIGPKDVQQRAEILISDLLSVNGGR